MKTLKRCRGEETRDVCIDVVELEEEEVGEVEDVVVVSLTCARQTGTHVRY